MSNPFVGELRLVAFNFNPVGWQLASGQTLAISQYTALFSLLGVQYGGNGTSNFQLPNMQDNVAVGAGQGPGLSLYEQGEIGGTTSVTLVTSETPGHNHTCSVKSALSNQGSPVGNTLADSKSGNLYTTTASPLVPMSTSTLPIFNGSSQPHANVMPYLGMYWIIAMQGVFPARQ